MSLTDWIAFGMGAIILIALGALFWKLTSSH
jgi:hypothetical protein